MDYGTVSVLSYFIPRQRPPFPSNVKGGDDKGLTQGAFGGRRLPFKLRIGDRNVRSRLPPVTLEVCK